MALFRLNENRYIDTDQIADITFTPENVLFVTSVPGGESNPDIPLSSNPSSLNIDLKSAEHIRLEGEEADLAWAAFEAVAQRPRQKDQEAKPAKEYATVLIENGKVFRVDTDAANATPASAQFDDLRGFPLVHALNKLAELGYTPVQGAIDHGQMHPRGANYTIICAGEK